MLTDDSDRLKAFGGSSNRKIIVQSLSRFIPYCVLVFIYDHLPAFSFLHKNREVAHKFARQMLADKDAALARGKDSNDVMSILSASTTCTERSQRR